MIPISADCWRNRYVLRAVVFSVAGPLTLSWQDLRSALKTLWAETTRASNWMVKELALADVRRDPDLGRIPKMPHTYLYPEARKQFPTLPSQTVAALEQAVTRTYKSKRYEIVWTCKAALPAFRYPQPVPIHSRFRSTAGSDPQSELDCYVRKRHTGCHGTPR
jgi:hypothetical protein